MLTKPPIRSKLKWHEVTINPNQTLVVVSWEQNAESIQSSRDLLKNFKHTTPNLFKQNSQWSNQKHSKQKQKRYEKKRNFITFYNKHQTWITNEYKNGWCVFFHFWVPVFSKKKTTRTSGAPRVAHALPSVLRPGMPRSKGTKKRPVLGSNKKLQEIDGNWSVYSYV